MYDGFLSTRGLKGPQAKLKIAQVTTVVLANEPCFLTTIFLNEPLALVEYAAVFENPAHHAHTIMYVP